LKKKFIFILLFEIVRSANALASGVILPNSTDGGGEYNANMNSWGLSFSSLWGDVFLAEYQTIKKPHKAA